MTWEDEQASVKTTWLGGRLGKIKRLLTQQSCVEHI